MKKRSYFGYIQLLRNVMITLIVFGIMLIASVQLCAAKYIIDSHQASNFIDGLGHLPDNPKFVFVSCLIGLLFFGFFVMERRVSYIENSTVNIVGAVCELVTAFILNALVNFSFPSIFLLVFCDCLFHFRRSRKGQWTIFISGILYFVASYQLITLIFPMADINHYFSALPYSFRSELILARSLCEAAMIVMTIAYIGIFLAWQIAENEDISKELSMVSEVNQELKNYAAITEKIGEDKERKRLAREIHDTLGHALTGIAAGVDACLVMIDRNPEAAKNQLQLVSKVVRQGISDVRSSLKKLRPGALEEQGLKGALTKMIQEFSEVSDVKITFSFEADAADFDVAKENVLFRLIQESITNAIRHGFAKEIGIRMYIENDELITDIQDDGIGCEHIVYGYGLRQMEERILTVHGHIEYDGSNGFATHAVIPLMKGEQTA